MTSAFFTTVVVTAQTSFTARLALKRKFEKPGCCKKSPLFGTTPPLEGGSSNLYCAVPKRPWFRGLMMAIIIAPLVTGCVAVCLWVIPHGSSADGLIWCLSKSVLIAGYASILFTLSWYIELSLGFDAYYESERPSQTRNSDSEIFFAEPAVVGSPMEEHISFVDINNSDVSQLIRV